MNLGLLHNMCARVPDGATKYGYLRSTIRGAIDGGEWPAGGRLPTEQDLAVFTGLSLGTVQRALRELVAQGYLVRQPGRGTFVLDRRKQMEEPLHCRFETDGVEGYLPVYTRLLSRGLADGHGPWMETLPPDGSGTVLLERAIEIGSAFDVHSLLYLSARRFSRLLELPPSDIEGVNIKKLLKTEFGVSVRSVKQKMRIAKGHGSAGDANDPKIEIRAIGYEYSSVAVYYQELQVPANDSWLSFEADV